MTPPIRTIKSLRRLRPATNPGTGRHRGQPSLERPSALETPANGRHRRTQAPALLTPA